LEVSEFKYKIGSVLPLSHLFISLCSHVSPHTPKKLSIKIKQHGISSFLSLPLKSSLILSLFPPTTTSSKFRINYLSCSSPNPFSFGFPQFCAKGFLSSRWWVERGWGFKGINELVLEGLAAREGEGEGEGEKQGEEEEEEEKGEGMVVMMDYCEFPRGGELVKKIIGMNFRGSLES